MTWYVYLLQFFSGLLLANGAPHFLHGISGARFQSPFASPPGVGESSPTVNVVWGFANLAAGFALLKGFQPEGADAIFGWICVGAGVLMAGLYLARHFAAVRSKTR